MLYPFIIETGNQLCLLESKSESQLFHKDQVIIFKTFLFDCGTRIWIDTFYFEALHSPHTSKFDAC